MRKALLIWSALVAFLVALSLGFIAWTNGAGGWLGGEHTPLLRPADVSLVELGGSVYREQCASCHGAALQGEPDWQTPNSDGTLKAPPHDESGHTWHHADDLLFRITKLGTSRAINDPDYLSNMPAFEGVLSDDEIVAVLSFIKAQWPPEIQTAHDDLNARVTNQP
ncbi:c-type cytochrome [Roseibium sp.]|uniref:c-type cytochrome n=1 Tax=Roseibium sp. TaxID=1936156 RepID=UPI001B014179|nr:c-type cytochrome [Roseibium sp.]